MASRHNLNYWMFGDYLALGAGEGHVTPKNAALLPLEFRIDGEITRWFTTVTSFGGPLDVLTDEITIEQFHPASG